MSVLSTCVTKQNKERIPREGSVNQFRRSWLRERRSSETRFSHPMDGYGFSSRCPDHIADYLDRIDPPKMSDLATVLTGKIETLDAAVSRSHRCR